MQIEIQIPKAVLFDVKYTVEQATNFAKKEVALGSICKKGCQLHCVHRLQVCRRKNF